MNLVLGMSIHMATQTKSMDFAAAALNHSYHHNKSQSFALSSLTCSQMMRGRER